MEFIVPNPCIVTLPKLTNSNGTKKRLSQLVEFEEDLFVVIFNHHVHKIHEKSWHDRHIKYKKFHRGNIVFSL
jgi:hypothetical protein